MYIYICIYIYMYICIYIHIYIYIPQPLCLLFQYGDLPVRRAVPLGLALLSTSKPSNTNGTSVVDTLSKMTHDLDAETATNAVFAMGLCAGGTNNSKVASNLRSLATYYAKEPGLLFAVRIAQVGLCTILLSSIVYGVWYTNGRSEGGARILPNRHAIVLQHCGQCRWTGE